MFAVERLSLPGVLLIRPQVFHDDRGSSMVTYNAEEFAKLSITADFKQDFISRSVKNVIRGIHFKRAPHMQDKLVRCVSGEIFDVVADYNPASPTFGTYVSVSLRAEEPVMLYVPGRYAHGFCVVSDDASVEYKIAGKYSPEHASGIPWNDHLLNIAWPVAEPIISEQDKSWEPLTT